MVHAIRAWHGYVHISEEYADLFDAYSMDGEGLTLEELRSLLTALNDGAEVSEADAADVLEHADVLGDGVIQRFELLGAIGTWYVSIGRDPPGATKSAVDGLRYASQRTLLQTLLVLFPCASGLCAGPQRLVSSCGGLGKGILALVVKAAQVAFAIYALVQAYPFLGAECPLYLAERVFVIYIFCIVDAITTCDFWCCGDRDRPGTCSWFIVVRLLMVSFLLSSGWNVYTAFARDIAVCDTEDYRMGWSFLVVPSLCFLPMLLVQCVMFANCALFVLTARDVHETESHSLLLQAEEAA
jgi:hypothetical protein